MKSAEYLNSCKKMIKAALRQRRKEELEKHPWPGVRGSWFSEMFKDNRKGFLFLPESTDPSYPSKCFKTDTGYVCVPRWRGAEG